jgi:hypothetical protein
MRLPETEEDFLKYLKFIYLPYRKAELDESELPITYDITQCAWCKRYVDKQTRQYVDKPEGVQVVSHGICPECKKKLLEEASKLF